jgi:hypothetical protein
LTVRGWQGGRSWIYRAIKPRSRSMSCWRTHKLSLVSRRAKASATSEPSATLTSKSSICFPRTLARPRPRFAGREWTQTNAAVALARLVQDDSIATLRVMIQMLLLLVAQFCDPDIIKAYAIRCSFSPARPSCPHSSKDLEFRPDASPSQ